MRKPKRTNYMVFGIWQDDQTIYAVDVLAADPKDAFARAYAQMEKDEIDPDDVDLSHCIPVSKKAKLTEYDEREHGEAENLCECGRRTTDCTYPETPNHGDN